MNESTQIIKKLDSIVKMVKVVDLQIKEMSAFLDIINTCQLENNEIVSDIKNKIKK